MKKTVKTAKLAPMFSSPTIRAGGNSKTLKGDKAGEYQTAIMYLAPFTASLMGNVCAMAETAGCVTGCLFRAGRAAFTPDINPARVAKTQRYFKDRAAFMAELSRDLTRFVRHCKRHNVKPAVRLNGTSDIQWEIAHPVIREFIVKMSKGKKAPKYLIERVNYASIFAAFPEIQFYDYTKIVKRVPRTLPSNYDLTLSYSGANIAYAESVLKAAHESGANIAVVYRSKAIRDSAIQTPSVAFMGLPVIDGDSTDMRFLDRKGAIVGLYAKGPAKKDTSGFVVG